jgi:hypothetical protein
MDAGITTVKIKCQDAVGYLAVYRYLPCTMYVLVAARYILRSSTSTCLQGPMLVYLCQNSDFFFGCYNVRGSGRAAMGKV